MTKIKYKKLVFISNLKGEHHIYFESAFINDFILNNKISEIFLIWEQQHIQKIKKNIKINNTRINTLTCSFKKSSFIAFFCFKECLKINNGFKIHLSLDTLMSPVNAILFSITQINIWIMHWYWREASNCFSRLIHFVLIKIIFFTQKNIKFIFLGHWIEKNIIKDKLLTIKEKNKIKYIDHPWGKCKKKKKNILNNTYAIIGKTNLTFKKIDYQDINEIKQIIYKKKKKIIHQGNKFLSYRKYIENIETADVIIFLYPKDSYKYRCSGILIEAINLNKRIIAIRNEMIDYFVEKKIWDIMVFDNIENLKKYILEN